MMTFPRWNCCEYIDSAPLCTAMLPTAVFVFALAAGSHLCGCAGRALKASKLWCLYSRKLANAATLDFVGGSFLVDRESLFVFEDDDESVSISRRTAPFLHT